MVGAEPLGLAVELYKNRPTTCKMRRVQCRRYPRTARQGRLVACTDATRTLRYTIRDRQRRGTVAIPGRSIARATGSWPFVAAPPVGRKSEPPAQHERKPTMEAREGQRPKHQKDESLQRVRAASATRRSRRSIGSLFASSESLRIRRIQIRVRPKARFLVVLLYSETLLDRPAFPIHAGAASALSDNGSSPLGGSQ